MKCAICGGTVKDGTTTVSVDIGTGVVVVRSVPARICGQCGEEWLSDASAEKVEQVVERARKDKAQIEVVALAS
jgi:YgiT-type zinc finger domain-containing protein